MKKLFSIILLVAMAATAFAQEKQATTSCEQDTLMTRIRNLSFIPLYHRQGIAATPVPEFSLVYDLKNRYAEDELCEMSIHGDNANLRLMSFHALCLVNLGRAIEVVCNEVDVNDNDSVRYVDACIAGVDRVPVIMVNLANYYHWRIKGKYSEILSQKAQALMKDE